MIFFDFRLYAELQIPKMYFHGGRENKIKQVQFKLDSNFSGEDLYMFIQKLDKEIKRLKGKIQMIFRSTYQEFDQQIISKTNRLMDEQMQCRFPGYVIQLQCRWNLEEIQMKFRCNSDDYLR